MEWFNNLFHRKPRIGLALSGGATLGAAHIGVLQVLEREGIQPEIVAGTSAGSLIGAMYCAGVPLDELSSLFMKMKWPTLIRPSLTKPLALFDISPMDEVIKKVIGDINFEDLEIPFACIVCDLMTGERIVLDKGPVAPAIRASSSIPGIFLPVEHYGRMLVDGGLVDNLPVEQAYKMGATYVIASDVSNRGQRTRRPGNIFEVIEAMFNIMQDKGALTGIDACDCYIRPLVTQYSGWEFGTSDKVLEEGRKAAELVLPQLAKLKSKR